MKKSELKSTTIKSMIILTLITAMMLHYSCEDDEPIVLLEEVSLSKTALVLDIDEVSPIIASATPKNTTENLTWNSNNEQIALVQQSENGLVVGVKGISVGSTTLTAKNIDGNLIKTTDVEVIKKVSKLEFTTATPIINVPSITLSFVFTPLDAKNQAVVWSSSDDSVATVSSNGLVTAIGVGEVNISLTTVLTTDEPQITIIKTFKVILENGVPVLFFDYCFITGAGAYNAETVITTGASKDINYKGGQPTDNYILTSEELEITKGSSFTISVTQPKDNNWAKIKIWIDWNGDKDFEDDGELVVIIGDDNTLNDPPFNASINVPADAKTGLSRMRIQVIDAWANPEAEPEEWTHPGVCGMVKHQTTKDFKVIILE